MLGFRSGQTALALLTLATLLGTHEASAQVLATASRVGYATAPGNIPLTDAGSTSLSFTTSANNQKVVVTYSATCSAGSVFLRIKVDGHATSPDQLSTFCSWDSAHNTDNVSAAQQGFYVVPTHGTHKVTVVADPASFNFFLHGSTTVVQK
ncbi:MAG: hypothetical protein U1E45_15935 [Geminicoccaceae bacterium]